MGVDEFSELLHKAVASRHRFVQRTPLGQPFQNGDLPLGIDGIEIALGVGARFFQRIDFLLLFPALPDEP